MMPGDRGEASSKPSKQICTLEQCRARSQVGISATEVFSTKPTGTAEPKVARLHKLNTAIDGSKLFRMFGKHVALYVCRTN